MRSLIIALAVSMIIPATGAAAQDDQKVKDKEVTVTDAATAPLSDLNLKKDEIPLILINAQVQPYSLNGMGKCAAIVAEVNKLTALLGPDIDLPQDGDGRLSSGKLAKSVVTGFVPFRGLVREVSGASDQQRRMLTAIEAGLVRRGFLKGVGISRGCPYPARAASNKDVQAYVAKLNAEEAREEKDKK